jgi:predicted enzyme related to lactoylglutathione lyase
MTMDLVVFPAKDLAASKTLFSALLGAEPYVDQPFYVGYRTGDFEFGLDPNGESAGPICYWAVADIDVSVQSLVAAGAQIAEEPHNVGGSVKIAKLTDAGGNTIGLRQA